MKIGWLVVFRLGECTIFNLSTARRSLVLNKIVNMSLVHVLVYQQTCHTELLENTFSVQIFSSHEICLHLFVVWLLAFIRYVVCNVHDQIRKKNKMKKKNSDEKREQTNKENMHVTLGIVKKDVLDGSHTVYYIPLRVIVKVKQ